MADLADALIGRFNGAILKHLGAVGVDEVYWDLKLEDRVVVLHGQHVTGLFVCATTTADEQFLEHEVYPFVLAYVGRPRSWVRRMVVGLRHLSEIVGRN